MKQIPILLCGTSVRAILTCAGCGKISVPFPCEHCGSMEFRKTQTRRTAKRDDPQWSFRPRPDSNPHDVSTWDKVSPYGGAGDVLWAKETWCPAAKSGYDAPNDNRPGTGDNDDTSFPIWYKATDSGQVDPTEDGGWEPSIFMPKEACRLWLPITEVRAQRLQEVTWMDAIAEGVHDPYKSHIGHAVSIRDPRSPRSQYAILWDSLNAHPKPVKRNPYTMEREDCYVSHPWEDVRKVETLRGKQHYVVGNAFVWSISFTRTQKP